MNLLALYLLPLAITAVNSLIEISFLSDGSYNLNIDGHDWLSSAPPQFQLNYVHCEVGKGLRILTHDGSTGRDSIGVYYQDSLWVQAFNFTTIQLGITTYDADPNVVIFSQTYKTPILGTSVGNAQRLISSFPRFTLKDAVDLGFLSYGGIMAGQTGLTLGRLIYDAHKINGGLNGGPLTLFDRTGKTIVITPFNNFMASSIYYNKTGTTLDWGIMGRVDVVNKDYTQKFIMVYGDGINEAWRKWGNIMRKYYGRTDAYRIADPVLNYIGYWTDNGAFYFEQALPHLTYEQTLISVKEYSQKTQLPYHYVQLDCMCWGNDSKNGSGTSVPCTWGTVAWRGAKDVFPHGMEYLWRKTGWPVLGHNMWWSDKVIYAKQNGGDFDFIIQKNQNISLPNSEAFWHWLFKTSKQWGLTTYEQDFLCTQVDRLDILQSDLYKGRAWLNQMGSAAAETGLTLQYCMSMSRHILQALEIPARASGDYNPNDVNWKIGMSSMFTHAVGIAPLKDTFWTRQKQPGNPYGPDTQERRPMLQAAVATLSTGPVGISDRLGFTDLNVVKRICTKGGLILKPDQPAMAIDRQYIQLSNSSVVHYYYQFDKYGNKLVRNPAVYSESNALSLKECYDDVNFCLIWTSPLLQFRFIGGKLLEVDVFYRQGSLVLLGEVEKFVPFSKKRITSLATTSDSFSLTVTGSPEENVTIWAYRPDTKQILKAAVNLPESGTSTIYATDFA